MQREARLWTGGAANEHRDPGRSTGSQASKLLKSTGSRSVEEVLLHLVETQEEQDRWLSENREAINAKIRRGIEHSIAVREFRTTSWTLTSRS
jgi:hypothetical protein